MRSILAALAALAVSPAASADIVGAWQIHGSVFFNAVDTVCHFKPGDGQALLATCEYYGKIENFTQADVQGPKVSWSWDAHRATLKFDATMTSDTAMKGKITVQGVTGSFTATKLPPSNPG